MNKKNSFLKIFFKIFLILLISIILFLIIAGCSFYFLFENKLNKINYVGLSPTAIEVNENIPDSTSNYRNIALLGLDTREDTYSGCRSDGIMILSINENTNDVKIVSVYRDTYLDIRKNKTDNFYLDKITHAYAFGEAQLTLNSLNRNLDLNIKEFVAVNFSAVVEAVDAVGGIDIDITSDEIKYINSYIKSLEKVTGKTSSTISHPGVQHLDGIQALAYCRIRYTSGGDSKRTERMRTVLLATFEKAKSFTPIELNNFADIILPHIYTNIQKNEIYETIPHIFKYNVVENSGWPNNVKGITLSGVWYGAPVNLAEEVSKLYYTLFGIENYEPSETVQAISNEINNKTGSL